MPCARCMFAPMLCIVATDSYKIDHHIGEQLIESQTQNPISTARTHTNEHTHTRIRVFTTIRSCPALRSLHSSFVGRTSDNRQYNFFYSFSFSCFTSHLRADIRVSLSLWRREFEVILILVTSIHSYLVVVHKQRNGDVLDLGGH